MNVDNPRARRRFKRRTVRVLVDYAGPDGARFDYATTLGPGGLFIETDEPLAVGSTLKVRFRLAGGGALHVIDGRVAWSHDPRRGGSAARTPGMAIEFTDAMAAAPLARELERLG